MISSLLINLCFPCKIAVVPWNSSSDERGSGNRGLISLFKADQSFPLKHFFPSGAAISRVEWQGYGYLYNKIIAPLNERVDYYTFTYMIYIAR